QQIARVASDAARAAHRLKMSRIEDDPHGPPYSRPLMLSVVVPTYNEAASVPKLAARLHAALAGRDWELVIVDGGSPDGTADIAAGLAPAIPVHVVRRAGKSGPASAVLAGVGAAKGDTLRVRAGDVSHPP